IRAITGRHRRACIMSFLAWATARAHSCLRHEPAAIAHDQAGERMADLDMEAEAPVLHALMGVAARGERERQRDAEDIPAPQPKPQLLALDHQRHGEIDGAEALAQQARVTALPFLLRARKALACKVALPMLAPVIESKVDLHRNIFAGGWQSDDPSHEARKETVAALNARGAARDNIALEMMHDLDRQWQ